LPDIGYFRRGKMLVAIHPVHDDQIIGGDDEGILPARAAANPASDQPADPVGTQSHSAPG
jgi:hypothetical protein